MSAAGGKATSSVVMGRDVEPTIFAFSKQGRVGRSFRETSIPKTDLSAAIPAPYRRSSDLALADVSERDVVAHFTRLTHRQYAVDLGAYPLGSCTMKYNPKLCDDAAALPGFTNVHPATPATACQGWLSLLYELEQQLCAVVGMDGVTLQPPAGAAGELTGLLLMRAWHESHGETRTKILIPDAAHGTNPASVTLAGYDAVTVPTGADGLVDIATLRSLCTSDVAGIMLTNPNTLGLFESNIVEIANIVHSVGGLLYYDGANLNAIMGKVRPGDMGFDIVHMNLHKTFAVPHGGGGPGAGPVGVAKQLVPFLPGPLPRPTATGFDWWEPEHSIGPVHGWHGNALALLRAFAYICANGHDGLREITERAVLNANYVRTQLGEHYDIPYNRINMHEFVASVASLKKRTNIRALDIAKGLLDHGFHAPTMYFPLIVEEALMIEPTETESKETLDALVRALNTVASLAETESGRTELQKAPRHTPVSRVDEARAARKLVVTDDMKRPE